jgi:hypothetical protein
MAHTRNCGALLHGASCQKEHNQNSGQVFMLPRAGEEGRPIGIPHKIGGIYDMLVAVELICKFFSITSGLVAFGSDCEAALYYIFDQDKISTSTTNSFDLIMASRKVPTKPPIQFTHRHVPDHQDIMREEMDIWGRANNIFLIRMLRPSGSRKMKQEHTSHQQIYVMNHGRSGYKEKRCHPKLKQCSTILSMIQM